MCGEKSKMAMVYSPTITNKDKQRFKKRFSMRFALLILPLLSSCTVIDYTKPDGGLKPSLNPYIVDTVDKDNQMAKLGAAQHPRILATYGGEYTNPQLERMVAKIVGKLTVAAGNPEQTYRITILNSPNVNAFALPGGYVYVTRGLLALANDSSEVAAVIAHEMAHVTANHGVQRLRKEAEVELSNQVVSEVLSDRNRERETELRGRMSLAQFSRNQELEADKIGIKTVAEAGYDPFASARFLQTMEGYTQFRSISGATDAKLDFLATHPATPQRIQLALAQARLVGAPGVGSTDRDSFLNGIDGMVFGDTAKEGYIRGQHFIHPELGIAFTVPNGFTIDNSSAAVVASGADDMAIRFDAINKPDEIKSAQEYIQSGWVSGLDVDSVRTVQIAGFPAATATAQSPKWQFDVIVIMVKNKIFRFLIAAPKNNNSLQSVTSATIGTFQILSRQQIASLKPLRIHVVSVKPGETVASLAGQMQGTEKKVELFRILNALSPTAVLSAGDRVKIIAE